MRLRDWIGRHPQLTAWAVLAVGMVIILIVTARDVGFLARQWAALIVATILLAGLCVWIIGWTDREVDAQEEEREEDQPGAD